MTLDTIDSQAPARSGDRNDINWRMRPLLMAMIAMHREWEEER